MEKGFLVVHSWDSHFSLKQPIDIVLFSYELLMVIACFDEYENNSVTGLQVGSFYWYITDLLTTGLTGLLSYGLKPSSRQREVIACSFRRHVCDCLHLLSMRIAGITYLRIGAFRVIKCTVLMINSPVYTRFYTYFLFLNLLDLIILSCFYHIFLKTCSP